MAFIALDRYNVIVKGLSAKPLTKKTAMLWNLLIWTMAIGWTIAPLLGWNRFKINFIVIDIILRISISLGMYPKATWQPVGLTISAKIG